MYTNDDINMAMLMQGAVQKLRESIFPLSSKKYYWYEIRLVYNVRGNRVFDWVTQVGVKERHEIMNRREIKKRICQPLHKNAHIKPYLKNGSLNVEVICELGRFTKASFK